MLLYINIAKFALLKYFTYPLEIIVYIIRHILRVGFIVLFWSVIAQDNNLDIKSLFAYFLLATSISDIVMSDSTNLGRSIRKAVQRGEINNILIRPVKIIQYYYAETIGNMGMRLIIATITLIIGLLISPPQNLISFILFIIIFIQAFLVAFAYNIFEGALSLVFTEVSGIKNAMHHVTRVLSGQLVPLTFFSESIRNILLLSPIPIMVFGPINALSITEITVETLVQILLGFIWAFLLNYLVLIFWKNSIKKYDAAGN